VILILFFWSISARTRPSPDPPIGDPAILRFAGADEEIRFTSSILPKWARRTKSLDALLPVLYLRGVSTGDFQEVLTVAIPPNATCQAALSNQRAGLPASDCLGPDDDAAPRARCPRG
jgi:hypothetical protein